MRVRNILYGTLVALYAVLWVGGLATRWVRPGFPAPAWTAPAFLAAAAGIASLGAKDAMPILVFAAGGFLAELIGVQTGIPFGRYAYSERLGPGAGGVPLAIACAWVVLLLFARDAAWRLFRQRGKAVLAGAMLMTALDLLIDPVATRILGYWEWRQPGAFLGVPLVNFAGWFGVSALLLALAGRPATPSQTVLVTGFSVVCFFAAIALA